jgi:hypothetical protein
MNQEQDKAGGGGNRVKSREKKDESTEDKAGTGGRTGVARNPIRAI